MEFINTNAYLNFINKNERTLITLYLHLPQYNVIILNLLFSKHYHLNISFKKEDELIKLNNILFSDYKNKIQNNSNELISNYIKLFQKYIVNNKNTIETLIIYVINNIQFINDIQNPQLYTYVLSYFISKLNEINLKNDEESFIVSISNFFLKTKISNKFDLLYQNIKDSNKKEYIQFLQLFLTYIVADDSIKDLFDSFSSNNIDEFKYKIISHCIKFYPSILFKNQQFLYFICYYKTKLPFHIYQLINLDYITNKELLYKLLIKVNSERLFHEDTLIECMINKEFWNEIKKIKNNKNIFTP